MVEGGTDGEEDPGRVREDGRQGGRGDVDARWRKRNGRKCLL